MVNQTAKFCFPWAMAVHFRCVILLQFFCTLNFCWFRDWNSLTAYITVKLPQCTFSGHTIFFAHLHFSFLVNWHTQDFAENGHTLQSGGRPNCKTWQFSTGNNACKDKHFGMMTCTETSNSLFIYHQSM